ncbi:hypothetical protein NA57DRAFT_54954 [Rhizodiscina lignyota]|uniref:Uncharacterized protein n=1 Tax=Rhizodiscina lignyota TaxID=1504668 RepID=A0A9P4IFM7_9PEZI|nr:hypothetical protein NA57DRAFT_54954 [Rhizodiscina lignyota]
MALFEAFSFSPSERHPSSLSHHILQVSPMSTPTSAYEPVPASRRHSLAISELSHKFSEQNISKPPSSIPPPSYFDIPVSPSAAPAVRQSSPPRDRSWSPPLGGGYRRLSAAAIRAQRQANIRLLSDQSHLRELSALVEQMVDSGSQCRVCTSTSSSTATSPTLSTATSLPQSPIDEGIDEMECAEGEDEDYPSRSLNFRRSGDVAAMAAPGAAAAACVRKDVRVRKQRRYRSSR